MNREVCRHGAPVSQHCGRCAIDPKSLAGVLLREHDSPEQALRYAERKTRELAEKDYDMWEDYARAAEQLRKIT